MRESEFRELLAKVQAAGFNEAANLMEKQRNGQLALGDYFIHERSGNLYTLEAYVNSRGEECATGRYLGGVYCVVLKKYKEN